MTVSELGRRMSSAEFTEWLEYAQLEPFGPLREDRRAGEIAASYVNMNRDRVKHPEPFEAADFFPELRPPVEPPDPEVLAKVREMNLRVLIAKVRK